MIDSGKTGVKNQTFDDFLEKYWFLEILDDNLQSWSSPVWPDGYIIFQYLAMYNIEKIAQNYSYFCQSRFKKFAKY